VRASASAASRRRPRRRKNIATKTSAKPAAKNGSPIGRKGSSVVNPRIVKTMPSGTNVTATMPHTRLTTKPLTAVSVRIMPCDPAVAPPRVYGG
jgi:hypothetical protein